MKDEYSKLNMPIKQDHTKPITGIEHRTVPGELFKAETPEDIRLTREQLSSSISLPEMLSIMEASERTNLSYEFLRYLCSKNKINYIRCGRKYMIDSESLAEFIKRGGLDK